MMLLSPPKEQNFGSLSVGRFSPSFTYEFFPEVRLYKIEDVAGL